MFGVGGGFLITPLLFFIGVPPAVAVATGANQVVASSVSGVLAQLKRKAVDFRMGLVLLVGGLAGSAVGVWVFQMDARLGQVDLFVQLSYVLFLGLIGAMMFAGKPARLLRTRQPGAPVRRAHVHSWVHGLPLEDEVPRQRALHQRHPAGADRRRGRLSGRDHGGGRRLHHGARDDLPSGDADQGGDRHLAVPDHLRHRLHHVMHAVTSQTVDMMLALLLILGGVIGAQIGARVGVRLKAEQLRILLSLLVLAVSIRIAADLLLRPSELYSVTAGLLP
jgi:uncharacterized membrane protein YfcA